MQRPVAVNLTATSLASRDTLAALILLKPVWTLVNPDDAGRPYLSWAHHCPRNSSFQAQRLSVKAGRAFKVQESNLYESACTPKRHHAKMAGYTYQILSRDGSRPATDLNPLPAGGDPGHTPNPNRRLPLQQNPSHKPTLARTLHQVLSASIVP